VLQTHTATAQISSDFLHTFNKLERQMAESNFLKSKAVSDKERKYCQDHGYKIYDKYLGGGAVGRVFLGEALPEKINANEKLRLLMKDINQPLQVRFVATNFIYFHWCTGVHIFGDAKNFCPNLILFFPNNV